MASNINTVDIDIEFPVPGQDNDSQGFRDNFTTILDNFAAAKLEIQDLQAKAVLKAALTDQALDNTFLDSEVGVEVSLINANLVAHTEQYYPNNIVDGTDPIDIDFNQGTFQSVLLDNVITRDINIVNWPSADRYARVTLQLASDDGTTRVVNFTNPSNVIYFDAASSAFWNSGNVQIASSTLPYIVEFWTYNSGSTVYIKYIGQFTTSP